MVRIRVESAASVRTRHVEIAASASFTIRASAVGRSRLRWWRVGGASGQVGGVSSQVASYSSPSELADLRAVLDRYGDDETEQIRLVLDEKSNGMRPVANPLDPATGDPP